MENTDEVYYRVNGLTKLDAIELANVPGIKVKEADIPDGSHGEVITFVALIAPTAIAAIAAYFLRKHDYEDFEEIVEETRPDGTHKRKVIRYKRQITENPEASVISKIKN